MDEIVTVAIVDDHKIARIGIEFILNNISFVKVIGEASSSQELFELLRHGEPDIVFMDIKLAEENGIDVTRVLLAKYPDVKVIALTMTEEIKYFVEMIEAGAVGFLLKNVHEDEIKKAVLEVMKGNNYFSKEFLTFARQLTIPNTNQPKIKLTEREVEVLNLICKGFSNQEIADTLSLSYHTIDSHRRNLMIKTSAKNTANLVMTAFKEGLIKNSD